MEAISNRNTISVEEAADLLGVSRAAAYAMTQRWRRTGGMEGLPVLRLGERRLLVPVPALRYLLDYGVPPRPRGPVGGNRA